MNFRVWWKVNLSSIINLTARNRYSWTPIRQAVRLQRVNGFCDQFRFRFFFFIVLFFCRILVRYTPNKRNNHIATSIIWSRLNFTAKSIIRSYLNCNCINSIILILPNSTNITSYVRNINPPGNIIGMRASEYTQ